MENNTYLQTFEEELHKDLHQYLIQARLVDKILPETQDIEEYWQSIATAYLPDGIREFADYPAVSLGWMIYIGMATAQIWDSSWDKYKSGEAIYTDLRNRRGYDCMDEAIREEILGMSGRAYTDSERLTGNLALKAYDYLRSQDIEAGTPLAFHAYVRTLHQLYIFGAAIQLHALGYRMQKV